MGELIRQPNPHINHESPDMTIDDLEISTRLYNFLKNAGLYKLEVLTEKTEKDLLAIRYCTERYIKEINDLLAQKGLSLKQSNQK